MNKKIFFVIASYILSNCAGINYRNSQQNLINKLANKNYKDAKIIIEDKNFIPEDRNLLLNKLEKGTTYYLNKDYYQALQCFDKAQEINSQFMTISLNKKLQAMVNNDNFDNYYGEKYEISLLKFYQSLTHYNLYLTGKYKEHTITEKTDQIIVIPEKILNNNERINHLRAARSLILEWDSLLSSYKKELAGKSNYKNDIVAKLWGAYIHEQFNDLENKQIALQLYKDAKDVLFKNYNIYATFNKNNELFNKNFNKFYKMNLNFIKNNYIESTAFAENLLEFIDDKITKLSKNNKDNLTIILKDNFISPKKAKKFKIEIPLNLIDIDNNVNILSFSLMALSGSKNGLPVIEFELPYVEQKKVNSTFFAKIIDKNKNVITKFPIVLLNPNSDIAYEEMNNGINAKYAKIGSEAVLKHATAIVSAYQIYKQNPTPFVELSAIASYKIAAKFINNTLKADLRYWSTLAGNIRMGGVFLKNGNYTINIYKIENHKNSLIKTFDVNINNNNTLLDLNI